MTGWTASGRGTFTAAAARSDRAPFTAAQPRGPTARAPRPGRQVYTEVQLCRCCCAQPRQVRARCQRPMATMWGMRTMQPAPDHECMRARMRMQLYMCSVQVRPYPCVECGV
eukprot:SAG22_NODE_1898_length_3346_cov_6.935017_1_plen_112_part_00